MAYRNYDTAIGKIVDLNGLGDFTTIDSAITAASGNETIFIRPGTYTENLTLKAGVNLVAFSSDENDPTVIIKGTCTMSVAGSVAISNISLQTNSSFFLTVSGSQASIVNLEFCNLNCLNNTGISFTSSSASAVININQCNGNTGTTGIGFFSSSSPGIIALYYTNLSNSGLSSTANTASAGGIVLQYSLLQNPITTSGTAALNIYSSSINTLLQNVISLTVGGSGSNSIDFSKFIGGTASAISIGSVAHINNCIVDSTNTNAITGAGTSTLTGISFSGTSHQTNTTNQSGGTLSGLTKGTVPSAGFLGEQIRSTIAFGSGVALSNGVISNITSISLTPGVWDISGIIGFTGATTGTLYTGSIVTTSATNGVDADNQVNNGLNPTAAADNTMSIPSWRQVFSSTTTVFLTCDALFTVGSPKGFGRISATRVG